MPPSVARFDVEVSGPKPRPNALRRAVEVLLHDAGLRRARAAASTSIASIAFMWREVSSTSPRPPAVCPARLVPPPRATTGTPRRAAIAHRRRDVVGVARERDRERLDREHARVAREQVPRVRVGAHFARQLPLQRRRQLPRDHVHVSPLATVSNRLMYRPGRHFLQIPGPTNVPDRVLRAIDAPTIDHRGPDFAALGLEVLDGTAAGLRDERPGRRLSRLRHRRVGGGDRQHAVARRQGDRVRDRALRDALAGDGARRSGSRSSWLEGDWRHGADPERIADALDDDVARRDGRPQRDLDRRHQSHPGHPRRDGRPRRAAARRHDLLARRRSTTATRSGASTSPSAARRRA